MNVLTKLVGTGAATRVAAAIWLPVPHQDRILSALHLSDVAAALPGGPHHRTPHRLPAAGGGRTTLTAEIDRQTRDPHVRTAMRVGALLEGGRLVGPWPCGDGGWSCGPFQILRLAHPTVSRAESQDPRFAVAYMLPAYASACRSVPARQWSADPRHAAALCAYRAERPARMYPAGRVAAAWRSLGG